VNSGAGFPGPGGWDDNVAHVNNPGGGPLDAATAAPSAGSPESTVRSAGQVPVEVILNPAANNETVRSTDDGGSPCRQAHLGGVGRDAAHGLRGRVPERRERY